mmetsp:Transcript_12635/g.22708  ORF Transcript_12635/g.22708 Transcript_12635/m.22708 type:complete len:215 (-) Transcript_12635:496-1140(-)
MQKFVPRASSIQPVVREDHGSTSTAKERILNEKSAIVTVIQVGGDNFRGDHQGLAQSLAAQQFLGQVNTDKRRAASHSRKIVRFYVTSQTKVRNDHGTQRWSRRKEGAVDDQNINFSWFDISLFQCLSDDVKNNSFGLLSTGGNRSICLGVFVLETSDDTWWPCCGGSSPRPIQDALHKPETFFVEAFLSFHHFHDVIVRALPFVGSLEGGETE